MARAEELLPALAQHELEVVPFRVLGQTLDLFGEEADVDELYEWFELVEADYERVGLVPAHCQHLLLRSRHANEQKRIYGWLGDHRDIRLALLMEGLERNASAPEDRSLHLSVGRKFLGDDPPSGFRRWCLRRAVEMVEVRPRASTELRWWATMQYEPWGQPLSNEEVAALTRNSPQLRAWNDRRLEARAREADEMARRHESPLYKRVREQQARYVASVREKLTTLEAGEGPLAVRG